MTHAHGVLTGREALDSAVSGVRWRWRLKHALRGGALALGLLALVGIGLSLLLKGAHYGAGVVVTARVMGVVAAIAAIWYFIVRRLQATPDDVRVALYVEEHDRLLGGALLTAVGLRERSAGISEGIAARLLRSALDGLRTTDSGKAVDGKALKQATALFVSTFVSVALIFTSGPETLRTGMQILTTPWAGKDPAAAFAIRVTPGNATIAKGGDQLVSATLNGFTAERAELLIRAEGAASFTRL
jgi:hypothetical protein